MYGNTYNTNMGVQGNTKFSIQLPCEGSLYSPINWSPIKNINGDACISTDSHHKEVTYVPAYLHLPDNGHHRPGYLACTIHVEKG